MSTDREIIDAIRLNYSQVIETVDKLFEYVHRKAQLELCKLQVEVKLHVSSLTTYNYRHIRTAGPKPSKSSVKCPHGATTSYVRQPRHPLTPNYLLIWGVSSVDEVKKDCQDKFIQLNNVIDFLVKIGQFNKAEELYNISLKQTSDRGEKQHYYNQLGFLHSNHGDYDKAFWYYKKALEIEQKTVPSNHPLLAAAYDNMAFVYDSV
ncbi:unnamed protein product [Adineta steineri]|uniref:Kinesin light chain n=1 Tax=Adineta steineri TaxID=433720 RepID=A0A815KZD2_9BILA|nr:unnamed protein product [Adineta steineri]CAF1523984.1 unnamed protein product [Adineta steineri]CAF3740783.1 unnamed protein product [Adineta steineri]CAF4191563.1 unnamed protein product [Adineta steineri]